jgi:hypothetical protein
VSTLEHAPELGESLAGVPLREIGDRLGVSHEQARRIIRAQGREIAVRISGELMVARREGKVVPVATIPDLSGPGFSLGLRWVDWLVGELASLRFPTRVHITPTDDGYVVALTEDLTPKETA